MCLLASRITLNAPWSVQGISVIALLPEVLQLRGTWYLVHLDNILRKMCFEVWGRISPPRNYRAIITYHFLFGKSKIFQNQFLNLCNLWQMWLHVSCLKASSWLVLWEAAAWTAQWVAPGCSSKGWNDCQCVADRAGSWVASAVPAPATRFPSRLTTAWNQKIRTKKKQLLQFNLS